MSFLVRPVRPSDVRALHELADSLATRGFLTLPTRLEDLQKLADLSNQSFSGRLKNPDNGHFLFVLEDLEKKRIIGSSLIMARHGTRQSPHHYFQVDPKMQTLRLRSETTGRTELGGLLLARDYRGHPEKLGKRLSFARLAYIQRHPEKFREDILAELLPPFKEDGSSPLWEAIGRKYTGMDYQEADARSRTDKSFVANHFPTDAISILDLPQEAQNVIGKTGVETAPVAKMLENAGFRYLYHIDPFDGGPHYGAKQSEIRHEVVAQAVSKGVSFS